jgi:hypothetical protein
MKTTGQYIADKYQLSNSIADDIDLQINILLNEYRSANNANITEIKEITKWLRGKLCCYMNGERFCDCKATRAYELNKEQWGKEQIFDVGSGENNGCCECREIIGLCNDILKK